MDKIAKKALESSIHVDIYYYLLLCVNFAAPCDLTDHKLSSGQF